MNYLIYGLIDPLTKELRYIGQSSTGMKRPKKHCYSWYLRPDKRTNKLTHKQKWVLKLLSLNLKPEIMIIESFDKKEDLNEAEIFYIQYYRSIGCKLTNTSPGGQNSNPPPRRPKGYKHSPETVAKLREINKGIIHSPEHIKKFMEAGWEKNRGRKYPKEHCQNISKAKSFKVIDNFGNIFNSYTEAAEYYNISITSVFQKIHNKTNFLPNIVLKKYGTTI